MSGSWSARTASAGLNVSERRAAIALIAAAVFFFWFAQYVYVPTLPTYVQSRTHDLAAIGIVLSMYGLWQTLIRLPLSFATDWLGWRKPFVLVGIALGGVGAWVMATGDSAVALALGRSITGVSAGAWVILVVAFSGLFPPDEAVRASSLIMFFNSFGRILASAATGPLNEWGGYALAFYVAAVVAGVAVLTLLPLHEPRRPRQALSMGSVGRLLARPDVLVPSLLNAVAMYANWGISYGFMAVLVKQFGGTSLAIGAITTLHIAMAALGNLVATSTSRRLGARRLVYAGFILVFVGIGIASLGSELYVLFAGQACIGLGTGIAYPVLMGLSIQQVEEAERTTAMGLHQTMYATGMFLGPAASGVVAGAIGIQPMFAVTGVGCLTLGLLGTRLIVESRRA